MWVDAVARSWHTYLCSSPHREPYESGRSPHGRARLTATGDSGGPDPVSISLARSSSIRRTCSGRSPSSCTQGSAATAEVLLLRRGGAGDAPDVRQRPPLL